MNKLYPLKFKLFADCMPVKGYKRSVIYDLNRGIKFFIPNSLLEFIGDSNEKSKAEIKSNYSEEYHAVIDEYIAFLEVNNFIYWMPEAVLHNFPKLNLEWDYPAHISNAILDIDENSCYDICDTLIQLEKAGCKHVQIRSFCLKSIDFYNELLLLFITSSYLSVEIITKYSDDLHEPDVKKFIDSHKRIKAIVFHSAPFNKIINDKYDKSMSNIAYSMQKIKSPKDCHNNSMHHFIVSVPLYTEAQQHHTYFNRKVSIDVKGNIKNCTSHENIVGNISTDKIEDVIQKSDFQKLWFVKKDETEVCRDCEFRYMCLDSRIPKQISANLWGHEVNCNYNPYIAKWKNEEGYRNLNECGIDVNAKEFKIDTVKLNSINTEIWGNG